MTAPSRAAPFDVYSFRDSSELLAAYVSHKRNENRHFSINGWAKRLGLSSSGVIVNFLKRRRIPPEDFLPRLTESMGLAKEASDYVRTLVAWERAKANESIGAVGLGRKLDAFVVKARTSRIEKKDWDPVSRLPFVAVKEALLLRGASADAAKLRDAIAISTRENEIERILEILESSGLFERAPNGDLRPRSRHVETETDFISEPTREFHRQSLRNAIDSIDSVPRDRRYFTSYAMAVRSDRLAEMREAIEEFNAEFVARFEAEPGAGDAVYQLNTNWIPLTKPADPAGEKK